MESTPQHFSFERSTGNTGGQQDALFLLTLSGTITGCSEWAEAWWRRDATVLAGQSFASLFHFESSDAGENLPVETWARLAAAAAVRPVSLQARVDGDAFEAEVQISAMQPSSADAAFLARVSRPLPAPIPTPATAPGATGPDPWAAFAGGTVGLFELNLLEGTARFSTPWKRLLGYEPDDLAPEPDTLSALIHPDDSEAAPHVFDGLAMEGTTPFSSEVRMRAKDDSWRWVQLEGVRRFDADGTLVHIVGIMIDAQERYEAEQAAQISEARFLRLIGRAQAGFFDLDLTANEAWFSPGFRQKLGLKPADLPPTVDGFVGLLSVDDAREGAAPFFQALLTAADGGICRYALRHAEGGMLPFAAIIAVVRDRQGEIQQVTGLQVIAAPPITAEGGNAATLEATLVLAHALRETLETVAEAVVIVDRQGAIVHVNSRAAQAAGVAATDLAGRAWEDCFKLIDRATEAPVPDPVARTLGGGPSLDLDHSFVLLSPRGHAEIVLTCRPLLDARQRPSGALVVFRNPAEMPLSPAELLSSNRMEALGRLACGIAHDFNNLLTTITGGISLAMDRRETAPLELAAKACASARNLARQLLTFARGDTSGKKVSSLDDTIRETARMAGAGSKTTIELELPADLHPVSIDPAQFIQVFTNLILNAMQVMPDGGRIWIRALNMPLGRVNSVSLPPGDYVRVDVQDNGPGIPPEHLERVFEPFFTTRRDGTGLGLPMVRSIIAQHEGAIEVVSTVGSGTTFTIYLPRASMESIDQPPPPAPAVTHGTGRILLMDDDPDLCMIAQGMLEMLGYEADTVQTAADAIAAYRRTHDLGRRYAAVILDLTMAGGLGGEEVFARLREIDPGVKAIVSSGYATDDHGQRYLGQGFAGILAKPYRSGDLGRVVKEVIGSAAR